MAQKIKIKRSTGSSAPSALENGELAYLHNNTTSKLYIGRPGGSTGDVEIIGGKDFVTKLNGIENNATADQTDQEIETAYNTRVAKVSSSEISAGTETNVRRYSPKDIHDLIDAHQDAAPTTAQVRSAGALMDDELTNVTAVKQLNQNVNSSNSVTFGGVQINNGTPVFSMKTNSTSVDDFRISVDSSSGDITFENHTNMGDANGTITNFMNYNQYGLALGNGGANTSSQNGGVSVSGVLYANNSLNVSAGTTLGSTLTQSGNAQIATGIGATCQIATNGGGVTMGYQTQGNTIRGNTTFEENLIVNGDVTLGNSTSDTVTISGDLVVQGATTTIESSTLSVEDTEIILNSDYTSGTSPVSAGITVKRGSYTDAILNWNDSTHTWQLNKPIHNQNQATGEDIMTVQSFETDIPTIDGGTF